MYLHILCMYVCVYTYIYIYIHICIWRISKSSLPHGLMAWARRRRGAVSQFAMVA